MTSLQTLHQVNVDPDEEELINDDDVVELIRELGKLKNLRSLGLTGVGNSGGLEDDVGNSGCRELEEAPAEGRNVFRASFCFSLCNLAYATA